MDNRNVVCSTKFVSFIFKEPINFPMRRIKLEITIHRLETAQEEG